MRHADIRLPHLFRAGKGALAVGANLATLLRAVVFVRQTALGCGFNLKSIGLRAMGRCDQAVVGVPGFGKPGRALGGVIGDAVHGLRTVTGEVDDARAAGGDC